MRLSAFLMAGAALLLACAGVVRAEPYPSRPVTLVVPFPPAGATDLLARVVGQKLAEQLGVPVVVTNRPGAGGNIGAAAVAKAPADGYTLLMGSIGTQAINQSIYARMPYNPSQDFAPITRVAMVPNLLVVHPSLPVNNVPQLVAHAGSRAQPLPYGSAGNGSSLHLSAELFKSMARVDLQHVPFGGSAPAMTALLGNQVSLMFDNMPSALPHVKAGKLRAIAVTSAARSPSLPDVPTIAEAGLPGYAASSWFGLLAPAKTPPEIVARLNQDVVKILNMPAVGAQLLEMGATPHPEAPAQFEAFIADEARKWAAVVKQSGARAD